ncbi:MAG: hypothetical protein AB7S78_14235 [Candidatus Omnitrophota bacterium]
MAKKVEDLKKKLAEEEKAFREKQKQLKARIQLEAAKARKVRDKFETHVKIIGGSIAFELAEQDEGWRKKMEAYFQGYLESRPGDWPYFEKFPVQKNGDLLFKLKEPVGWQEVLRSRGTQKTKSDKEKKGK